MADSMATRNQYGEFTIPNADREGTPPPALSYPIDPAKAYHQAFGAQPYVGREGKTYGQTWQTAPMDTGQILYQMTSEPSDQPNVSYLGPRVSPRELTYLTQRIGPENMANLMSGVQSQHNQLAQQKANQVPLDLQYKTQDALREQALAGDPFYQANKAKNLREAAKTNPDLARQFALQDLQYQLQKQQATALLKLIKEHPEYALWLMGGGKGSGKGGGFSWQGDIKSQHKIDAKKEADLEKSMTKNANVRAAYVVDRANDLIQNLRKVPMPTTQQGFQSIMNSLRSAQDLLERFKSGSEILGTTTSKSSKGDRSSERHGPSLDPRIKRSIALLEKEIKDMTNEAESAYRETLKTPTQKALGSLFSRGASAAEGAWEHPVKAGAELAATGGALGALRSAGDVAWNTIAGSKLPKLPGPVAPGSNLPKFAWYYGKKLVDAYKKIPGPLYVKLPLLAGLTVAGLKYAEPKAAQALSYISKPSQATQQNQAALASWQEFMKGVISAPDVKSLKEFVAKNKAEFKQAYAKKEAEEQVMATGTYNQEQVAQDAENAWSDIISGQSPVNYTEEPQSDETTEESP